MDSNILVSSLSKFFSYLDKKQRIKAIVMFIALFLSSLLDIFGLAAIIPVMMAASEPGFVYKNKYLLWIYNTIGFSSEIQFLIVLIVFLLIFFIFKTIFLIFINYTQAKFIASIGLKITNLQFEKYANIPYLDFQKTGSSKVMNYVVHTPTAFTSLIIRTIFALATEALNISIIIVGIFIINPLLLILLALILAPSSFIIYSLIKKRSYRVGKQLNILRPVSQTIISDVVLGFIEIKLLHKESFFQTKLIKNQRKVQILQEKAYLYSMLPAKSIEVVAILGIVLIFLYSLLIDSTINMVALLGLFAAAAYRLMPSINRLLQSFLTLKNSQYIIENLNRENKNEYLINGKIISQEPIEFNKTIEFKNIVFSFPETENYAVNNVSLTINRGEKIGFIGSSGSGKSTLMSLLLRFYEQESGLIEVDKVNIERKHIVSWRSKIGYVKQDVYLMSGTIRENIALGINNIDEEKLLNAIQKASLNDFIQQLPNGVDTIVQERGSNLSGGQRQRIGIARALYLDAEILVLDEATSALDNETEKEVTEAINNLSHENITMLVVAHRVTTLKDCDRIYELENGRIKGIFNYEDVLQKIIL